MKNRESPARRSLSRRHELDYQPNNAALHQHDHFELMYVLDGELTNKIERISYTYKKGCLPSEPQHPAYGHPGPALQRSFYQLPCAGISWSLWKKMCFLN